MIVKQNPINILNIEISKTIDKKAKTEGWRLIYINHVEVLLHDC